MHVSEVFYIFICIYRMLAIRVLFLIIIFAIGLHFLTRKQENPKNEFSKKCCDCGKYLGNFKGRRSSHVRCNRCYVEVGKHYVRRERRNKINKKKRVKRRDKFLEKYPNHTENIKKRKAKSKN
jgi:hypothetical protein